MYNFNNLKIAVIGLGYVGLPLAIEFSKHRKVIGFDINEIRLDELRGGLDRTLESDKSEWIDNPNLNFSSTPKDIQN